MKRGTDLSLRRIMMIYKFSDSRLIAALFEFEKIEDIETIKFPVIIKPHSRYGARGFHIFQICFQGQQFQRFCFQQNRYFCLNQ